VKGYPSVDVSITRPNVVSDYPADQALTVRAIFH
jgi:hypothetical protein